MKISTTILLLTSVAMAQNSVLHYTASAITAKAGEKARVALSITLDNGYHANSNKPNDPYLIPLRLTWNGGPLTDGEIVFPKAQLQKFGFSKKPVSVFTGRFDIVTTFAVARDLAPGRISLTGKLHYQACDDHECLTPKTIDVTVPIEVVK